MSTKLTLTIDQRVIERAKQYARQQGRSLSNLIEDYLRLLTELEKMDREPPQSPVLSPKANALYGILAPLEKDFDRKKAVEEALIEKYG